MRHSLLYLVVKESALIPRKREHVKHRCVPYWLRDLQVFRDQPLISLTPAAVKVQFLILVFECVFTQWDKKFFIFSFLPYNPVNNPLRGYGCI
uniref:Photosystem II reaction centre I protein (PSII 4.8 kDa protein) n=1 Tax=Myoviridae sp. ct0Qb19 TaxID=2827653 RepID=A0A8S5SZL6_9CAUD|nr:MAG TPA: Photosystem II reaction centre I protein (PSII 4.8 kDa protein) [Myoviridae sp. ct0Qb19]